ncbi:Protein of unknown function [Gryllus bimaculatus]|nr:Protein of unknown function [Gryllus bimaculatus]
MSQPGIDQGTTATFPVLIRPLTLPLLDRCTDRGGGGGELLTSEIGEKAAMGAAASFASGPRSGLRREGRGGGGAGVT